MSALHRDISYALSSHCASTSTDHHLVAGLTEADVAHMVGITRFLRCDLSLLSTSNCCLRSLGQGCLSLFLLLVVRTGCPAATGSSPELDQCGAPGAPAARMEGVDGHALAVSLLGHHQHVGGSGRSEVVCI